MSRYRDIDLLGMLHSELPRLTIAEIWAMGSKGPFGRVYLSTEIGLFHHFINQHPKYYYPQLKMVLHLLPIRTGSYNCGIFVQLTMIDIILQQWSREWLISDLLTTNDSNPEIL